MFNIFFAIIGTLPVMIPLLFAIKKIIDYKKSSNLVIGNSILFCICFGIVFYDMISDPYKIAKWSMSESIVSWIFRRVVVTSYLFEWYVYLDEKWVETKNRKKEKKLD